MRRYIGLLEHEPSSDRFVIPPEGYVETCNSTLEEGPFRVRVNSDGFILSGNNISDFNGLILVLGDSIIENYLVTEDCRACSVAERIICELWQPMKVLNGGVSGATTVNLLNVIINKIIPLKPSAIVLASGAIDALVSRHANGVWTSTLVSDRPLEARGEFSIAERGCALSLIDAICREVDIPLSLSTFGFTKSAPFCFGFQHATVPDGGWLSRFEEVNNQTRQFAQRYGRKLIDLSSIMSDREDLFYDGLHANVHGCDVMGRLIALSFLEN